MTEEFQETCERLAVDPALTQDPGLWRRFGFTLVEGVMPTGHLLPVEVADRNRPDGRLEFTAVRVEDYAMSFSALDILAASLRSKSVPSVRLRHVPRPLGTPRRDPKEAALPPTSDARFSDRPGLGLGAPSKRSQGARPQLAGH